MVGQLAGWAADGLVRSWQVGQGRVRRMAGQAMDQLELAGQLADGRAVGWLGAKGSSGWQVGLGSEYVGSGWSGISSLGMDASCSWKVGSGRVALVVDRSVSSRSTG